MMTNEPPECSTCGSDYNLPDPGEPYESGNCDKCEIEMLCADLRKSDHQIDELRKWAQEGKDDAMAYLNAARPNPDSVGRHQQFARGAVFSALLDRLTITEKRNDPMCPEDVCPHCYHHVSDPAHRPCMSSDNRK